MAERPVLEHESLKDPVTNTELEIALAYAKQDRPARKRRKSDTTDPKPYVGQVLSKELLRVIVNTALERWINRSGRRVILPMLVAHVVRDVVPQFKLSVADDDLLYQAYKCGAMKLMSIRRVWQMKADKRRKERGEPIPERVKQTEHPQETKKDQEKQLRLFS